MFENSPLVDLTVGRSSVRQRILALLMDESNGRLHLREIQRRAGTSPGTASRELAKLAAAGLVDREAEGNQVYFRASSSPFAAMLRSLLVAMPAPELKPRPRRLPRTKAALAGTAPATEPGPSETAIAGSKASDEASPAPEEAVLETAPADLAPSAREVQPTDGSSTRDRPSPGTAPRVIRPQPGAQDPHAIGPTPPSAADVVVATPAATPGPSAADVVVARSAVMPTAAAPDPFGLEVAGRLAESIRSIYGETVRGIFLCGARAFGPAPADADVETVVVLDRVDHYGAELERTSHACAALSHELNLVVSRIFVSEAVWNGGSDGVQPLVKAEAVAV